MELKVPSRGAMNQTKDVVDLDRRLQFQFYPDRRLQFQLYLHNIAHMEKNEDMSRQKHKRLRVVEEEEEINWVAI